MPEEKTKNERQPYQVRLPGFITDGDVGLGDVFKACYVRSRNQILRWLRTSCCRA